MKNPYTGVRFSRPHPPGRRRADFAFAVVAALGLAYLFAYVWPWWPWSPALNTSGEAVGFLYAFIGGYAFLRSRGHRLEGDGGSNAWLAWTLIPVAVWDAVSPIVLQDFHAVSIVAHLVGGSLALGLTVYALRAARLEPVSGRTTRRIA